MVRMLVGLSTRRYRVGLKPVADKVEAEASWTSRLGACQRSVSGRGLVGTGALIRGAY